MVNDPEIIDWLNSDSSREWRETYLNRVGYTTCADDGQDATDYRHQVAFASLKFDDSVNEHDVWVASGDSMEFWQARVDYLRRAYPRDPELILWDGFLWDPDLDPTRA